jgi:hypothetical protein
MAITATENIQLACVPDAIPVGDRAAHFELARELFHVRVNERSELTEGFAFRFPRDAFEAVARFVANERKCCPFVTFELSIGPEPASLLLQMTGPKGTRAILEAELDLPGTCSSGQGGSS